MITNFRNFLRKSLRKTEWGALLSVLQDIWDQDMKERIDSISHVSRPLSAIQQRNVETLIEYIWENGFDLPIYDGYSSTVEYIVRQAETIKKRNRLKSTLRGYPYIFYVFNVDGNASAMIFSPSGGGLVQDVLSPVYSNDGHFMLPSQNESDRASADYLFYLEGVPFPVDAVVEEDVEPWESDSDVTEVPLDFNTQVYDDITEIQSADQDQPETDYFDTSVEPAAPVPAFPENMGGFAPLKADIDADLLQNFLSSNTPDMTEAVSDKDAPSFSSFILLEFGFRNAESGTHLITRHTCRAFLETVRQTCKSTEIPVFEPILWVPLARSGLPDLSRFYTVFGDDTEKRYISSVYAQNTNLNDVNYIEFGTGGRVIDDTVTTVPDGCTNRVGVYIINESFQVRFRDDSTIDMRFSLTEDGDDFLKEFSEIALWTGDPDDAGVCLGYITLPVVELYAEVKTGLHLTLQLT